MTHENITVQLAKPERKYIKTYLDFLDNNFLTSEEQMIFIALKSYIDFKNDSGEAYPSMETLCKRAKMSEKRARKNINTLIKKGIVKKIQRGLSKTNLYTLADYPDMWTCDSLEDVKTIIDNNGVKPLSAEDHIRELGKMGYMVIVKEKEPVTAPTKVAETSPQNQQTYYNTTLGTPKSQDPASQLEEYTMGQVHQLYDYNTLTHDNPYQTEEINAVMDVLHSTLNTSKPTIRLSGQDRPSEAVKSRLLKLTPEMILYAINRFAEQTGKIQNPSAYMLSVLYSAVAEYPLYISNTYSINTNKKPEKGG